MATAGTLIVTLLQGPGGVVTSTVVDDASAGPYATTQTDTVVSYPLGSFSATLSTNALTSTIGFTTNSFSDQFVTTTRDIRTSNTAPPSPTATVTSGSEPATVERAGDSGSLSIGAAIGIGIAVGVVVIAALALTALFCYRKRRRRRTGGATLGTAAELPNQSMEELPAGSKDPGEMGTENEIHEKEGISYMGEMDASANRYELEDSSKRKELAVD